MNLIVIRSPKFVGNRKFKVRRHNTNNGGGLAINPNALSDDVSVAVEIALPDLVTQNRYLWCAGRVVASSEIATHDWRHAEHLEEVLGHIGAGITLRIVFVGHVDC